MGVPSVGAILDGYELRDVLREEGAAVLFRAHHGGLRRDAEVRVLRSAAVGDDPSARERFRNAAVAIAALGHPGLVPVYAMGEADGATWVASRLFDTPSVADAIAARTITPREALDIFEQVAEVLDALHASGLVHRDLRPETIWVVGRHVVLGLPGIARTDGATRVGTTLLGDAQYLAPEQLHGDLAVPASDVFALGSAFCACLVGGEPYGRLELGDLLRRRASGVPPVLTLEALSPADLNAALASVLAAAPADRPKTAIAALRELRTALAALPERILDTPAPFSTGPGRTAPPPREPRRRAEPAAESDAGERAETRFDRQRPVSLAPERVKAKRSRWQLPVTIAAALGLVVAAAAGGYATVTKPGLKSVRVEAVTFPFDARWQPAADGGAADLFAQSRTLKGPGGATAVVGIVRDGRPRTDPLAGMAAAKREGVQIAKRPALLYSGDAGERVLVIQTDRTTVGVACSWPAGATPDTRACDALAGAVRPPGRVVGPEPSAAAAETLSTVLLSLHNLVVSRQLTLESADAAERKEALANVQELYKRAIADLSGSELAAPDQAVVAGLVTRLRQVVKAYDGLLKDDPPPTARATATLAVNRLRASVKALARNGYQVGEA